MKLLGRDIPARELIARIEERLRTRGLPTSEEVELPPEGVEPRVEPLTFNLHALEEYADATRALPLHTHRGGVGQVVLLAKWAFRKSCQVFINEALGRQRVFNGHVRDSYAQLSAEVLRLRREVEALRARPVPAASDAAVPQQEREPAATPAAVAQPPTAPVSTTAPGVDTVLPKPRAPKAQSRQPARPKQPVNEASTEVDSPSVPRAPATGEPVTGKTVRAKKAAPSAPAQPSTEASPRRSASGQKKRRNKKSR
ncbi:hypothetical protein [Myxococcus xanthus]|uniref:Uncharacterized protein n=1 Tax=Myxococcus xanthus TaxID=34 RepID=A0A7Y4IPK9_MYXXA|nr:hypothetical protein [Myxococcus xanthus]NOJ83062.1 hypothetical protein [Myxococcus xanthus]NOJ90422.1 hypothetical protein [Myxococcus xanthus]